MGRDGNPGEIAATALFRASDGASYFTGGLLHPSRGVVVGRVVPVADGLDV
jgi:NAD(P)-dependent dehydrogenase (short-subunit alcohol dehydrogenase family)